MKKDIKETDLFKRINMLAFDRDREHLEEIKERLSLILNVEVDNSGFFRGIVEYFYENQDALFDIADYVKNNKGYNVLARLEAMMDDGKSIDEIDEELGIGKDILSKIL